MNSPDTLLRSQGLRMQARLADSAGNILQAELLYLKVLELEPGDIDASMRLAHFAMLRSDGQRALGFLERASAIHPDDSGLAIDHAVALVSCDRMPQAIALLQSLLSRNPVVPTVWLLLGQLLDDVGDRAGALRAWHQAVTRARRQGQWASAETTPAGLADAIVHAIGQLRTGRRELFFAVLDGLRHEHGAAELRRVERALTGYLREWDASPADPRQRPKFFYFPDLPSTPYYDPYLQPWAGKLKDSFADIRNEAIRVIEEDRKLPDFIEVPDGAPPGHLAGEASDPSWEALFFYRHGVRYDANHARCPATSRALESIELCRIADQAPEILFSVLRPGTHILPHHGVTNVRLVMHLPLVVPNDCALNLVDVGEHRWQEGRLVMFDDTYSHEAWNRSDKTRVVLLMDCWNPLLTEVEKAAVKTLIETIGSLQAADKVAERVEAA